MQRFHNSGAGGTRYAILHALWLDLLLPFACSVAGLAFAVVVLSPGVISIRYFVCVGIVSPVQLIRWKWMGPVKVLVSPCFSSCSLVSTFNFT